MIYKNTLLFIVGIMHVLHTYTMNDNQDHDRKKLLDSSFYTTTDNGELLKTMLARNIDPNIHNTDGNIPLHFAASNICPEYISILITAGANPNKINWYSCTPLHYAATAQQYESIQLLLNNKANPNLANNSSETPLHAAINYFVNPQIVELLLSSKTNPNLQNMYGNTPLHKAVIWPNVSEIVEVAQLLLQYGAQVDIVNNQHYTPLRSLTTYTLTPGIRKMGRMLVWHHYILLPHFTKVVPKEIACIIASHVALLCAEQPTIWS